MKAKMYYRIFSLAIFVIVFSSKVFSQQVARSLTASTGLFMGFYEYKPADYATDPTKKYPLIIFLHGIGERGNGTTELSRVLVNGIPRYINAGSPMRFTSLSGTQETFLVLSPQLSMAYGSWQNIYVDEMLKYAKANLQVDTNRIYLTGLSLGGGGTWKYATASLANARQFAAIATICGTCEASNLCNLSAANLPVWAFHAQNDGTVGVGCTTGAISMLNSCNPAVKPLMTIYPTGNHWIWDQSYDTTQNWQNPNVFEWFLGQGRNLPVNKLPVANAGADKIVTLPLNEVQLSSIASSDQDGTINRVAWRMIQTPGGGWLESPAGNSTWVRFLSQGTYRFELTVIDDRAGSAKDTVTVTVNPTSANVAPVANAGNDSVIMVSSINVDASSSYDPDGFVASYSWRQVTGPTAATVSCTNCPSPVISNLSGGTYSFEAEVTDNIGAKSKDTVFITDIFMIVPIQYLYFKGRNLDNTNILLWGTVQELGNDRFEIEMSRDGKQFQTIATLPGAGVSTTIKEYKYEHVDAPQGFTYYRLRQVDKNGASKYSTVLRINNSNSKWTIETYPNPVKGVLLVQMNSVEVGLVKINLFDQRGKKIIEKQLQKAGTSFENVLDVRHLPRGIYFIELSVGADRKEIRKVVKE